MPHDLTLYYVYTHVEDVTSDPPSAWVAEHPIVTVRLSAEERGRVVARHARQWRESEVSTIDAVARPDEDDPS
jgi:hypothetical protein